MLSAWFVKNYKQPLCCAPTMHLCTTAASKPARAPSIRSARMFFSFPPKQLLRAPPCGVRGQQPVRSPRRRRRRGDRGPQGVRGSVREGRINPFRRCHSLLSQLILFSCFVFAPVLGVVALTHSYSHQRLSADLVFSFWPFFWCCCATIAHSTRTRGAGGEKKERGETAGWSVPYWVIRSI